MIANKNWILTNYTKFNKEYFGAELPSITAKISRAKSFLGKASAYYDHISKSMQDYSITMSIYFDQPEEIMFSTLLHEMIHIKDYYKNGHEIYEKYWSNKKHRGHGSFFLNEAARISNESGYQIDVKASLEVMAKVQYSEATKKAMATPYLMFASDSFKEGCGVFRLPKNATASDVASLMKHYNLNVGYILEGTFKIFANKRGSLKSGRIVNAHQYQEFRDEAISISDKLESIDAISTLIKKINNRKQ